MNETIDSNMASLLMNRLFTPLLSWNSTVLFLALPQLSCTGATKTSTSAGAEIRSEDASGANFEVEGDAAWDQDSSGASSKGRSRSGSGSRAERSRRAASSNPDLILLGARHDVTLKKGAPLACQCLRAVLGQPDSPLISWSAQQPITNRQEQLVIVLGSEDVPCDSPGPGASYMGYIKKGADVVVSVEAIVPGRPVTHGAIIPLPKKGGQVFVTPSGDIPYGRGLDGEARCALGPGK